MGSSHSALTRHVALTPQPIPVVAINARYCQPRVVTLEEKSSLFLGTAGRTFQDAHTNVIRFIIDSELLSSRKTLCGPNKAPIANYKSKRFSSEPNVLYVHPGTGYDDREGREWFQIYVKYDSGIRTIARVQFADRLTSEPCEIGFAGNWKKRDAFFWLKRGETGVRSPVAKVYSLSGSSRDKYRVEIVTNMDTALIVMLCGILEDKSHSSSFGSDGGDIQLDTGFDISSSD